MTILAYLIAFQILMSNSRISKTIIDAGGRLGLKSKKEDTIGRILKGLTVLLPP